MPCVLCGAVGTGMQAMLRVAGMRALAARGAPMGPHIVNAIDSASSGVAPPMVCRACRNWCRYETMRGTSRVGGIPATPLDRFVLHCMKPSIRIDPRTRSRLFRSVAVPGGNAYGAHIPYPAQAIVHACHGDVGGIVHAWWQYNGCPLFLHDRHLAAAVRRLLYNGDTRHALDRALDDYTEGQRDDNGGPHGAARRGREIH